MPSGEFSGKLSARGGADSVPAALSFAHAQKSAAASIPQHTEKNEIPFFLLHLILNSMIKIIRSTPDTGYTG
jgi:hypothetical protein